MQVCVWVWCGCKTHRTCTHAVIPWPMAMPAARTLSRSTGGRGGIGLVLGAEALRPSASLISMVVAVGARERSIRARSLAVRLATLASRGAVRYGMLGLRESRTRDIPDQLYN